MKMHASVLIMSTWLISSLSDHVSSFQVIARNLHCPGADELDVVLSFVRLFCFVYSFSLAQKLIDRSCIDLNKCGTNSQNYAKFTMVNPFELFA